MATSSGKLALVLLKGSSLTQPGQKAPLVAKKVITRRAYHSSAITRVDATVHSFGRLIKAAVSDKESKKKASTKDNFAKVGDEEQMNTETLINEKRGESDRFIESEKEEVRTNLGSRQDGLFEMNIAKAKAAVDAAAVPAIDPMFSIRGQQKAYELHKLNPHFWNPARLANLFRVSLARMRISLWMSHIDEQAEAEGHKNDYSAEQLLADRYGELDFPGEIAQVPDRIRYKVKHDTFFYMDSEVKSAELMKALRNKDMVHYREAPRLPRKTIPSVQSVAPRVASRANYKIQPGKYQGQWYMWDISPQKDMYNRHIVIRETDGSFRTGNWQDRRFAEDYRRYIKWPMKVPHVRPDENEPDHVPNYARVPEGYKVEFDKNT